MSSKLTVPAVAVPSVARRIVCNGWVATKVTDWTMYEPVDTSDVPAMPFTVKLSYDSTTGNVLLVPVSNNDQHVHVPLLVIVVVIETVHAAGSAAPAIHAFAYNVAPIACNRRLTVLVF